jgi:alpha-beta hydrolase superfamily lysophospholipase
MQAHGAYPTVRYPAALLAAAGHIVYALDFPGHGESPGTRGLIRAPQHLTADAVALAQWATV